MFLEYQEDILRPKSKVTFFNSSLISVHGEKFLRTKLFSQLLKFIRTELLSNCYILYISFFSLALKALY